MDEERKKAEEIAVRFSSGETCKKAVQHIVHETMETMVAQAVHDRTMEEENEVRFSDLEKRTKSVFRSPLVTSLERQW